jgi:dethiobiotin synthetase
VTTLLVTGTGTGVGKTVVTAAVAALAAAKGERVLVLKPAQTGEPDGGAGDLTEVVRLAGPVGTLELARYPDPLSPAAAARRSGRPALTLDAIGDAVAAARAEADLVLVEGAGGLLVHYDDRGLTMAEVAAELGLPVLLVTTAGLGTLNTTALTLEAMERRELVLHSLVIGAWPTGPELAERCNVGDLETLTGRPLAGVLPDGAGGLGQPEFLTAARDGLGHGLGGRFDPTAFRESVQA